MHVADCPRSGGLHKLVLNGDPDAIAEMHRAATPDAWQRELCSRDARNLTPLALACHAVRVEAASKLLELGAASSIFVRDGAGELVCTLPYVSEAPAEETPRVCEQTRPDFPDASRPDTEQLKAEVDAACADYIERLAAGKVRVPDDAAVASAVCTRTSSPAPTPHALPAAEEICEGDVVRLSFHVGGSTIAISQRYTDNTVASNACLGAAGQGRLGVVIGGGTAESVMVSSLESGYVCEYARGDLVFADGSSIADPSDSGSPETMQASAARGGAVPTGNCARVLVANEAPVAPSLSVFGVAAASSLSFGGGTEVAKEGRVGGDAVDDAADNEAAPTALVDHFKVGDTVRMASSSEAPSSEKPGPAFKPDTKEVLMVCSVFHAASPRGIVVCRQDDPSQLWLVAAADLVHTRAVPYTHVYQKGDLVQLDRAPPAHTSPGAWAKCLLSPSDGKRGVVLSAGGVRRGIQRNIQVAAAAGGGSGDEELRVSFYSAFDLLPVPRVSMQATQDEAEQQTLIETLESLSARTDVPLNAPLLVEKFGMDVFSKLWVLFTRSGATVYATALEAFSRWMASRVHPHGAALPTCLAGAQELLALCDKAQDEDAALETSIVSPVEAQRVEPAASWSCVNCDILNSADQHVCIVCASNMPTWQCGVCKLVHDIIFPVCKFCHSTKDEANAAASTVAVGARVRWLDGSRGRMGCIASVDLDRSEVRVAVAQGMERRVGISDAKIGDEVCLATKCASMQGAATGPLLPGDKARILSIEGTRVLVEVVEVAGGASHSDGGSSLQEQEQGHLPDAKAAQAAGAGQEKEGEACTEFIRRDAMGRVVVEDGVGRLSVQFGADAPIFHVGEAVKVRTARPFFTFGAGPGGGLGTRSGLDGVMTDGVITKVLPGGCMVLRQGDCLPQLSLACMLEKVQQQQETRTQQQVQDARAAAGDKLVHGWYEASMLAYFDNASAVAPMAGARQSIQCKMSADQGPWAAPGSSACPNRENATSGVFFDVLNSSSEPIVFNCLHVTAVGVEKTLLVGFAPPTASLSMCTLGACKSHEEDEKSWREVWTGDVSLRTSTCMQLPRDAVVIPPGQVQGFFLHTRDQCVQFARSAWNQEVKDMALTVKPWVVTTSRTPFDRAATWGGGLEGKACFAGKIDYSFVPTFVTETCLMKDLALVQDDTAGAVPRVKIPQLIKKARVYADNDTVETALCSAAVAPAAASDCLWTEPGPAFRAANMSVAERVLLQARSPSGPLAGSVVSIIRSHKPNPAKSGARTLVSHAVGIRVGISKAEFEDGKWYAMPQESSAVKSSAGWFALCDSDWLPMEVKLVPGDTVASRQGGVGRVIKVRYDDNKPVVEVECEESRRSFDAAQLTLVSLSATPSLAPDTPLFPEDEASVNERSHTARLQASRAFEMISKFDEFAACRSDGGNTVAHHLALARMPQSLDALLTANRMLRWVDNDALQTPQALSEGLHALSSSQAALYRAIHDGGLLQMSTARAPEHLVRRALTVDEAALPGDGGEMEVALEQGKTADVLRIAARAVLPHRHLYAALAMMRLKYSTKQVLQKVRKYLEEVAADNDAVVEPLLYYVRFRLYVYEGPSTKARKRQAACALSAIGCYPQFSGRWLKHGDKDLLGPLEDSSSAGGDSDDDEEEIWVDVQAKEAENEWETAKADHQLSSVSMDELMMLTGLGHIKRKALGVVKERLLQKSRPDDVKAETSMNFLFTGNPGCGKTTVARLLAKAMHELGFRQSSALVETSARDILSRSDPAEHFGKLFQQAMGGCLFIDEAYRFNPRRHGSGSPNASNDVLDNLLEQVEKPEVRKTTTVILAGYRDEIESLLSYNVGFASRFALNFAFPDYSQDQLSSILVKMLHDRGFRLESKKECGMAIARVVGRRIHQGAGKKGFGNARAVRNKVEEIIVNQSQRIGTMALRKEPVPEETYRTITALDAIGARPNFDMCKALKELNAMAGLDQAKAEFRKLLVLTQQNYDREMRGEAPESISIHRVFYGNPGTGKTTVARLYGALLKELGLLSKGDFISVTPADLMGMYVGEAARNTVDVLARAKGKVLLIDEAYVLNPKGKSRSTWGGNVLDTLVEKLDGEAGSDIAVILTGYKQQLYDMMKHNLGLRRRFNLDDFGVNFPDMSDDELKEAFISMTAKSGLVLEDLEMVDEVIAHIAQKRRLPGFGNAATVASLLNLAKVSKAARIDQAQLAIAEAPDCGNLPPAMPDPDVLLRSDFIPQAVDPVKARDAFASLYNTEHIVEHLDELEDIIMAAEEDGLEPADVLADAHMVFVGPPGTGKTTVAGRFGNVLKDLGILPSANVITVTGTSLMGQYTGETKEKVLEVMEQARGGILFIDEAYGLMGGTHKNGSYGKEAVDTLVGNMTNAEFKGNLLVIMAGYEKDMDALFAEANPGFSSRFNKKRIVFNAWTAEQVADAVVSEIVRGGKTLTPDAEEQLLHWCRILEPLPSWGSARDVFETILPSLFAKRASRLRVKRREARSASPESSSSSETSSSSSATPYEAEDVDAALSCIAANRRKLQKDGK